MKRFLTIGAVVFGLAAGSQPTRAQATRTVYTVVDQLPQLPTGGGRQAVEEALSRSFTYPDGTQSNQVSGILYFNVVVTRTGQLAAVQLKDFKGEYVPRALPDAVVEAFRHLPQLTPALLKGRPVDAQLPVRWEFKREAFANRTAIQVNFGPDEQPDLSDLAGNVSQVAPEPVSDDRVYIYVEQMPSLPGGGAQTAIVEAMQRLLVVPTDAPDGLAFVSFIVEKQGQVSHATIAKSLSASADAAALAAVNHLPTFVPGKQNGRLVRVQFTLPVAFGKAAKKPALPRPTH